MFYILNSAVVTAPGLYRYQHLSCQEAANLLARNPDFVSRVGYPATAQFIATQFGIQVSLSRESSVMQPGDQALIVRLKYRLAQPEQKAEHQPQPDDFELGLLTRIE